MKKSDKDIDTDYDGIANGSPIKIRKIGNFLLTLIDRIRMVNPTPNNPNSSRSHVLIFIKVPKVDPKTRVAFANLPEKGDKYLIIGDLAGVENKFTCDQDATQKEFLNLTLIDKVTGEKVKDAYGQI